MSRHGGHDLMQLALPKQGEMSLLLNGVVGVCRQAFVETVLQEREW